MKRTIGLLVIVGLFALAFTAIVGDLFTPPPATSDERGATTNLGAGGASDYRDLLLALGHDVGRGAELSSALAEGGGGTAIYLGAASLSPADLVTIERFVGAGGRFVFAGEPSAAGFGLADSPSGSEPAVVEWINPAPETRDVGSVSGLAVGYRDPGAAAPLAGSGRSVALAVQLVDRGEIVWLADAGPLLNDAIGFGDNAVLGANLAGEVGSDVFFIERLPAGVAEEPSGWDALPVGLRRALAILAGAVLMWMAARSAHVGPPDARRRELPPARVEYIDAMGETLTRTGDRSATLTPVREEARRILGRRVGRDVTVIGSDELRAAASGSGLAPEEIAAIASDRADPTTMVAAGRGLVKLRRWRPADE